MTTYSCPGCGHKFTNYDEHLELIGRDGKVAGIGCARCSRRVDPDEKIKVIHVD